MSGGGNFLGHTSLGVCPGENVLDSYHSPPIKRLDGLQAEDSMLIELVFA
jgi:hypothetical protein